MSYSGAQTAKTSRENLGRALAALQEDPNIPPDVLAIAQNVAQAMAALFDAERSPTEPEGKAAVKRALGVVGQTLALLQDVRATHAGIQVATSSITAVWASSAGGRPTDQRGVRVRRDHVGQARRGPS